MNSNLKRFVMLAVTLMMIATTVIACGGGATPTPAPVAQATQAPAAGGGE